MPVAISTVVDGSPRSGHTYDDRTGISYEFPARKYLNWVVPGERFVYHATRVGYIGCGVFGEVTLAPNPDRRIVEILDYSAFDRPVAVNDPSGIQYEAENWSTGNVYWGQGVRPLNDRSYERILTAAEDPVGGTSSPTGPPSASYPASDVALEVESISVDHAVTLLNSRYPAEPLQVMPRNNPGFDIRIGSQVDPVLFVEVKGTMSADPVFFISEGERQFSERNAKKYLLLVFVGIVRASRACGGHHERTGAVVPGSKDVSLEPRQWRGRLL